MGSEQHLFNIALTPIIFRVTTIAFWPQILKLSSSV